MGNIIIILLNVILIAISVILIYDARTIVKKFFSMDKLNETTKALKILGFILLFIGLVIIYNILY